MSGLKSTITPSVNAVTAASSNGLKSGMGYLWGEEDFWFL